MTRWLLLLGGLGALGCGGELAASGNAGHAMDADAVAPVATTSPTVGGAPADAGAPPTDAGDASDAGRVEGADAAVESPAPVDAQAEADARWLPACGPGSSPSGAAPAGTTAPPATGGSSGKVPTLRIDPPGQGPPFEAVRRVLRRDAGREVERCAREARGRSKDLQGVVLTRFVVSPEGKMDSAEVLVGVGDPTWHACLTEALRKPKLPKVTEGRLTLSKVPIVLCPDGRTLLWPDLVRPAAATPP